MMTGTRPEQKIVMGASNGGYHYLGSAKIMGQIGKAIAEACWKWRRIKSRSEE